VVIPDPAPGAAVVLQELDVARRLWTLFGRDIVLQGVPARLVAEELPPGVSW
jgi:hypothetical protein